MHFLVEHKPGKKLNNLKPVSKDKEQSRNRSLKKDFQIQTREYFSKLKIDLKYHDLDKAEAVVIPTMSEIIETVSYPAREITTIENVISELLDKDNPFQRIGTGVINGSKNYYNKVRSEAPQYLDTPVYYSLFLEYNKITNALKRQIKE